MSFSYKDERDARRSAVLHAGDCLTQSEFHELYLQSPESFNAELIGGMVFVGEPVGVEHSDNNGLLNAVFAMYSGLTRGVGFGTNATVILGVEDEVQPDLLLRILPSWGGQTQNVCERKATYIKGAPELVAEVALTSRSIDLHLKRKRYAAAGVREYLVVCLDPWEICWFDFAARDQVVAESDGTLRSRIFPGLWVHAEYLRTASYAQLVKWTEAGIASPEHARFVHDLEKRHG